MVRRPFTGIETPAAVTVLRPPLDPVVVISKSKLNLIPSFNSKNSFHISISTSAETLSRLPLLIVPLQFVPLGLVVHVGIITDDLSPFFALGSDTVSLPSENSSLTVMSSAFLIGTVMLSSLYVISPLKTRMSS